MSGKGVPARGRAARGGRGDHIPPPPEEPAPEPPLANGYRGDFCKYSTFNFQEVNLQIIFKKFEMLNFILKGKEIL